MTHHSRLDNKAHLGDSLAVETKNDTAELLVTGGHIEVDLGMGEQLTAGQVFRLGQHTLWVILGPLTASVDWAKKTKVKVRITKREMTTL